MSDALRSDLQALNWYVLFVRSNQEKKVARCLVERGIEHFLPCYRSRRQWTDRRVDLETPLFPGYVFVRLLLRERMKALIIPNVVSLIGTRTTPSVVSDGEIMWVRRGVEQGTAGPHEYLHEGQRVLITQGVLSGLEGILVRMQNNTRVVVSLESIQRAFMVDVDETWLQPIGARPCKAACEPVRPGAGLRQRANCFAN
jgi:transcription antitermination factor NusG